MRTSSCAELHERLRRQLRECAYPGYVYGYPHKKAYRPLPHPVPLRTVWEKEDRRHLFAYVHIPFCGQRCSFCNLFTHVPTDGDPAGAYLDALAREAALKIIAEMGPAARSNQTIAILAALQRSDPYPSVKEAARHAFIAVQDSK